MRIEISRHNRGDNVHVGYVEIEHELTESEIAAIANEAGGMADLVGMGESTIPEGYEWTGDEVFEVVEEAT